MSKTLDYLAQSLAATGFAIVDSQWAYTLRPDLWSTGQECVMDFRPQKILTLERTKRMIATIDGRQIPLLARGTKDLVNRIEMLTGAKVENLTVDSLPTAAATPARRSEPLQKAADRREKLRQLADQVPPAHDCSLRKEILAARAELGMAGG